MLEWLYRIKNKMGCGIDEKCHEVVSEILSIYGEFCVNKIS